MMNDEVEQPLKEIQNLECRMQNAEKNESHSIIELLFKLPLGAGELEDAKKKIYNEKFTMHNDVDRKNPEIISNIEQGMMNYEVE